MKDRSVIYMVLAVKLNGKSLLGRPDVDRRIILK
jgi:hypothetical protein